MTTDFSEDGSSVEVTRYAAGGGRLAFQVTMRDAETEPALPSMPHRSLTLEEAATLAADLSRAVADTVALLEERGSIP